MPDSRTAQNGDAIRIHYTGRLDDGTVFDSSEGRQLLGFTVGSGQVIPGFDDGVRGMAEGEKQTVRIPAERAYGERDDERILTVPREQFPAEISPEVGMQLQIGLPGGGALPATVTDVQSETVTLDANHQLAGEALTFDIELVSIDS
jgi:FKBP-type peptidyl-prolyl cis-trans isomerase 2